MFEFFGRKHLCRRLKVTIIDDMSTGGKASSKRLDLFKKKMRKVSIAGERGSSINNAFASALAMVGVFDEDAINRALGKLGQPSTGPLRCVYCDSEATDADHLVGLVKATRYTGHGQVIGNLVPSCGPCNQRKGNKPWRAWAASEGITNERIARIGDYETLAPPAVSEEQLRDLYPDLMEAYERLKNLCKDTMRVADHLANEIQRLEKRRLGAEVDADIADPEEQ